MAGSEPREGAAAHRTESLTPCEAHRKLVKVTTTGAIVVPVQYRSIKGDEMAGKFEITKDKAGKFRFRLKAANGEIIATSEAYESKASAKNGIESVQKNAPGASVVDLTE